MIESVYNLFVFQSPFKLSSLLNTLSDYIFMFFTYYLYYKKKLGIIKLIKELVTSLITFIFAYNNSNNTN